MTAKKQPTDFSLVKWPQTRMASMFFGIFVGCGQKIPRYRVDSPQTAHGFCRANI